jgi:hypothetical protein
MMHLHYAGTVFRRIRRRFKTNESSRIAPDHPHRHDQFVHDPCAILRGICSARLMSDLKYRY